MLIDTIAAAATVLLPLGELLLAAASSLGRFLLEETVWHIPELLGHIVLGDDDP